jgi:hypothetical protein
MHCSFFSTTGELEPDLYKYKMPSIEIIEAGEDGYDISDDTNVIIEDTNATCPITKDVEFIQRYHIFATFFFFF